MGGPPSSCCADEGAPSLFPPKKTVCGWRVHKRGLLMSEIDSWEVQMVTLEYLQLLLVTMPSCSRPSSLNSHIVDKKVATDSTPSVTYSSVTRSGHPTLK